MEVSVESWLKPKLSSNHPIDWWVFRTVFQRKFHGEGCHPRMVCRWPWPLLLSRKWVEDGERHGQVLNLSWDVCLISQLFPTFNAGNLGMAYEIWGLAAIPGNMYSTRAMLFFRVWLCLAPGLDGSWSSCFGTIHSCFGRDKDEARRSQHSDGMMKQQGLRAPNILRQSPVSWDKQFRQHLFLKKVGVTFLWLPSCFNLLCERVL